MDYAFYTGILILLAYQIFDRKTIRVEWRSVASFCAFLTILTAVRISGYSYLLETMPGFTLPKVPEVILGMGIHKIILVFWEDAFFVLPIYFAMKRCRIWVAVPLIIVLSAIFGMGHAYQGYWGIFVTSLYPFCISYRFGKKYGFGTVMICHILYDFATIYTLYFLPWLIM